MKKALVLVALFFTCALTDLTATYESNVRHRAAVKARKWKKVCELIDRYYAEGRALASARGNLWYFSFPRTFSDLMIEEGLKREIHERSLRQHEIRKQLHILHILPEDYAGISYEQLLKMKRKEDV